ncbi:hypothetical protein U1Q18_004665 [Sarracenia purpurea var. burkii]
MVSLLPLVGAGDRERTVGLQSHRVVRARGRNTIFVGNLPEKVNQVWLGDIFSRCERVTNVFIPRRRRPISYSRFEFVTFALPRVAFLAINRYDKVWCLEKRLKVRKTRFQTPSVPMRRYEETVQQDAGRMKHLLVKVTQWHIPCDIEEEEANFLPEGELIVATKTDMK